MFSCAPSDFNSDGRVYQVDSNSFSMDDSVEFMDSNREIFSGFVSSVINFLGWKFLKELVF